MRSCTNSTAAIVVAAMVLGIGGSAWAAFPGANGRIVFDREDVEVWSILPDGTGETNLSNNPADDDAPAWSPDGTRIAFSSDRDGNPDIWVMDADGQNLGQVTSGSDDDDHPAWSADGTRIVFQRGRGGDDDVWVVNVDGSGETNLTNEPLDDDGKPNWSPDGTTIAFERDGDIWVMNADGSGQTNVSDAGPSDPGEERNPHWSPDGTQIVFDSDRDGDQEIFVMGADGSGQTQLTFNDETDQRPAWSPDGTKIVWEASRSGDDQIHVMDTNGANAVAVTDASNPDDDRAPDWQPLPLATTTTTVAGTTTSTTLPESGGIGVAGKKLLLKDKAGKPQKRALKLIAKDAAIGAGAENGSAGDPTLHGGFLKVVSASGDGFNTTYDLPAGAWRTKGKPGKNKGYKLKQAGPIRKILVKLGKTLKVVAKGEALGHTLGADPNPVHVALGLGAQVYCLTFGGQTKFKAGKTFSAKQAPAPAECTALVPQCGDGRLEEGESCPGLEGPPAGRAVDAVSDYITFDLPIPASAHDVEDGRPLVRTRIELVFFDTTTVGQLEAILDNLGGRISSMLRGVRGVVVDIPDPGSVAALNALVADVLADPAIELVRKAHEPPLDELPPNYSAPLGAVPGSRIDHLLAVRAPAAWNARAAMRGQPTVVVFDNFGNGVPDAALDATLVAGDFTTATPPSDHGYHVSGIIAGRFGGDMSARGLVTGMSPRTTLLRVVDRKRPNTSWRDEQNQALMLLAAGGPNGILNTSIGEACSTPLAQRITDARWWTEQVRTRGLEPRMLHFTSAGNIDSACPTQTAAAENGDFAGAALLSLGMPNLTNVLVVENAENGAGPHFMPRCLDESSKTRGHLAGIGEDVWSFTGAGGAAAGPSSGTSMATPQAAGLATYAWSIDPTMSVQQLRGLLLDNAVPLMGTGGQAGCSALDPAPIIDAYATVLALDETVLPTPATAPVRFAILDLDADDAFDDGDLIGFALNLVDGDVIHEPTDVEFERFDLNGDGYTGGAGRTRPFDLDRVGSTQYGTSRFDVVSQMVEGIPVPFDETDLDDLQILCYYAYSDLYTGDPDIRRQLLDAEHCAGVEMVVDFATEIEPGISETLTVTLGRTDSSGSSVPVPDLHIELSPAGGTAMPASGTTDAQGEFRSQIELAMDSTFVEVVVQALTGPGGDVLAEEVVSAGAPCTDPPAMVDLDFGADGPDPTVAGPTLQNGAEYRIRASGTFSIWTGEWQNGVCKGAPAGGVGGPTGLDAEYWFGIPVGSTLCGGDFDCCPNGHGKFQISLNGGGSFAEADAVVDTYDPSHVYEYRVRGQGQPVYFRLKEDSNRGDDYGILQLDVECASATTTTTTTSTTTSTTTTTTTTVSTTSVSSTSVSSTSVSSTSVSSTSVSSTSVSSTSVSSTSVSSTSVPTTSTTSTTLFAVPVVPYTRYDATGPDGPVVMVADEFASTLVDLGTVVLELPPVAIDGQLPPDPTTHQTCYAHPGGLLDDCVDIQDRFGFAPLRIGNPVGVCIPELFPSVAVDAFACYQAEGTALDLNVTLDDEFQSQAVTIGAPELFCTPAEIDGDPLQNAARYLVCYATTPTGVAGGQIMVENALHPGPIPVDVGIATGLCVPAVRQLVPSCDLCGNAVTDAGAGEECDDGNVAGGDGCSAVCRTEGP